MKQLFEKLLLTQFRCFIVITFADTSISHNDDDDFAGDAEDDNMTMLGSLHIDELDHCWKFVKDFFSFIMKKNLPTLFPPIKLGWKKKKIFDELSISFPMQMTGASICHFPTGRKQYFLSIRPNLFLTKIQNDFPKDLTFLATKVN